jgi:hypothetical protein
MAKNKGIPPAKGCRPEGQQEMNQKKEGHDGEAATR